VNERVDGDVEGFVRVKVLTEENRKRGKRVGKRRNIDQWAWR
jgi:hypothetical protein